MIFKIFFKRMVFLVAVIFVLIFSAYAQTNDVFSVGSAGSFEIIELQEQASADFINVPLEFKHPCRMKKFIKDGNFQQYYEDGTLYIEGVCRGEQETGTWSWFYPDGKLWTEKNYVNGKLDGIQIVYDRSGSIADEKMYSLGKFVDIDQSGEKETWVGNRHDEYTLLEKISGKKGRKIGRQRIFLPESGNEKYQAYNFDER